jgi:putative Mg2+ transporter-C (MgtC) family protein
MASWWERVGDALAQDFSDLPDGAAMVRAVVRLLAAAALGGALGWERGHAGKSAGLRTHMLVSLGAALLVLVPQQAGMSNDVISRVIQGMVAGIGFLGAGAILKPSDERHIFGLTTAASIWMAAAIGITAGLGRIMTAALATVFALGILALLARVDQYIRPPGTEHQPEPPADQGKREAGK